MSVGSEYNFRKFESLIQMIPRESNIESRGEKGMIDTWYYRFLVFLQHDRAGERNPEGLLCREELVAVQWEMMEERRGDGQ